LLETFIYFTVQQCVSPFDKLKQNSSYACIQLNYLQILNIMKEVYHTGMQHLAIPPPPTTLPASRWLMEVIRFELLHNSPAKSPGFTEFTVGVIWLWFRYSDTIVYKLWYFLPLF
jgi:hypothetical protein